MEFKKANGYNINITVYHGSNRLIDKPDLSHSRPRLDFGSGFYVSSNKAQVINYIRKYGANAIVSKYDLDLSDSNLNIKTFDDNTDEWIDFVIANRHNNLPTDYDIVYGPIADDKVASAIKLFESNRINRASLKELLKFANKEYQQYCLRTEKALMHLKFIGEGLL